ncbi:MAG TPA: sialate O-acetylesterase, partial [Chryseolinea sp.]|nr:sialate O-acetylesterase [Chryseolinea sp.]
MKKIFSSIAIILLALSSQAQLRLPAIFDDHMVIQQQSPVPIWGWAHSTQDITINVSWDTTTLRTKTDNAAF